MNRIRALRQERKLSTYALADLVGTTQATIQRLETGKRKLTVDWMQRIARALDVKPTELLAPIVLDDDEGDVEIYNPTDDRAAAALGAAGRQMFKVMTRAVDYEGIKLNDVVAVDCTKTDETMVLTGDIVLAAVISAGTLQKRYILRVFVKPCLLTTNSSKQNYTPIDMHKVDVQIVGVVVR